MSYELFEKGFIENNAAAKNEFCELYNGKVAGWVRRVGVYQSSGESLEFFVNESWLRFLIAVGKETNPLFKDNNRNLGAVLNYLKMCTGSAIIDYVRRNSLPKGAFDIYDEQDINDVEEWMISGTPSAESVAIANHKHDLVQAFLERECQDQIELQTLIGIFIFDMKPREILDEFSTQFKNIKQIYRIKENFLKRVRRNQERIPRQRLFVSAVAAL